MQTYNKYDINYYFKVRLDKKYWFEVRFKQKQKRNNI